MPPMKLSQAVREYVDYKQALGMRFHTEAVILQGLCRTLGDDTALLDITEDQIHAYLHRKGPLTRFRQRKLEVLTGFNCLPSWKVPDHPFVDTSSCHPQRGRVREVSIRQTLFPLP